MQAAHYAIFDANWLNYIQIELIIKGARYPKNILITGNCLNAELLFL